jgi:4,5-dihydroxyphthalate decarboxylase
MQELTVAFWNYDRTLPLADGRVGVPGARLRCSFLRPEEAFARAFGPAEFDVSELSFSNSVTALSRGDFPYRLIPVFLSRAFRLDTIFVRADRGIRGPQDLRGRRIGLQEYDMTAAVVVRGYLRDRCGVAAQDLRWCVGDVYRPKPLDFPLGQPPDGVEIEMLTAERSLEARLEDGELDAVITLRPPARFRDGDPRIARLFPDPVAEEKRYFAASGVFPIMHAVGVRRDVLARDPGIGRRLYDAFCAAKRLAVDELEVIQAAKVTLPWLGDALLRVRSVLGEDFWPYGLAANRTALEAGLRWSREDGLQARPVRIEELFDPACLDT